MKIENFDFDLPEGLIAKTPAQRRDGSRLLVLGREGSIEHRLFSGIKDYLREGDLLVLNDSKVVPVRLSGRKETGGRIEILLVKQNPDGTFVILSRGSYTGRACFGDGTEAEITEGRLARFNRDDMREFLWREGKMPLPPYIRRAPDHRDREWYQTVYAEKEGSIAAPTAGLHFTEGLLGEIAAAGVAIRRVTLHVGPGTFMPVRKSNIEEHRMEPEEFEVDPDLPEAIKKTRNGGGRVFTVGTTTTRTIEALLSGRYVRTPGSRKETIRGSTDLFIYPGYRFRGVDGLLTNFHLPRSTPLMLACAFAGRENLLRAYGKAVESGYRFFSYGDAMLIL